MQECTTYDKKSLKTVQGKTADFSELAKDCVAFANARGGSLHIGIEDGDEQILIFNGSGYKNRTYSVVKKNK